MLSPLVRRRRTTCLVQAVVWAGALSAFGATNWDGSTDSDWFDSTNWSAGIPDSNDDVIIPSSLSNYPVLDASGAVCRTLTIQSGASLDLATFSIDIHGNLDPQATGVITSTATGELTFVGNVNRTIDNPFTFSGDIRVAKTMSGSITFGANVSFNDLFVDAGICNTSDASARTQTISGNVTVASGPTLTRASATLDIAGNVTVTGTFDDSGTTGGTFVAGNWTVTGTFSAGTKTVTFDGGGTSTIDVVGTTDFHNLTVTGSTTVVTASDVDLGNDLTVTSGEFEVGDTFTIEVNGDVSVTGTFDLEPGATVKFANNSSFTVNSGGTFEALGTGVDLAVVTVINPGGFEYSFSINAGGIIKAQWVYFRHMDANGIQITDNGSVTALTQLDRAFFDNGDNNGTLLKITNNDDTVSLNAVQFFDTNSDLNYNVETVSATATITIDPYDDTTNSTAFGGPANENDNGSGTVTPGFIVWGTTSPVRLRDFSAHRVAAGVLLEWETAAEWNVLGFAIERAASGETFAPVGPALLPTDGRGPDGSTYRYVDTRVQPTEGYRYRLMETTREGTRRVLATSEVEPDTPRNPPLRRDRSAPSLEVALLKDQRNGSGARQAPASLRRAARSPIQRSAAQAAGTAHPRVKIFVAADGVTRVPQTLLASWGFSTRGDPRELRLRRGDAPWPITVVGGEDGSFDPGDAIDFVAAPFASLETRFDVYWLERAPAGDSPPRIAEFSGTPPRGFVPPGTRVGPFDEELEEDFLYVPSLVHGEGRDHWFWEFLLAPGSLAVSFEVNNVAPNRDASVELFLEGWSEDLLAPLDHLTRVSLNGVELGELSANGAGPYGDAFEIPAHVLRDGPNLLTLEAQPLVTSDLVFLDRLRLTYPRFHQATRDFLRFTVADASPQSLSGFTDEGIVLYQITGRGAPRRIVGAAVKDGSLHFESAGTTECTFEAFTSSGARLPAFVEPASDWAPLALGGVDTIVIAPHDFWGAVEPWIQLRESEGRRVAAVSLEQIYDTFGGGRETTDALKAFLTWAHPGWTALEPPHVLLVGDATYDPRGNLGPSPRQILPTRLLEGHSLQTASDNWFADVEGDDGAPEFAIGRLPVATVEECQRVIDKFVRHARSSPGRNRRTLLVSDRAEEFHWMQKRLRGALSPPMRQVSLRLGDHTLPALRDRLRDAWQAGLTFVHYTGHGSRTMWSAEEILSVDDVAGLVPASSGFPIVIALNCLNGFFHHVGSPSLGETLLLDADGGAIAYWGPTGLSSNLGQQALADSFYEHIQTRRRATLGRSVRHALRAAANDPARRTLVDTWILLGDPTLRVSP